MRLRKALGGTMPRKYDEQHRMPNRLIEEQAGEVFAQYVQTFRSRAHEVPVRIGSLLDSLWSFELEINDLQKKYGVGTHGALYIYGGERRIVIDKSLDPKVFPQMRGRYNYSLAHEAGHWVIHAPALLAAEEAPELFHKKSEPTILCRSSQRDERERQADRFAGFLLMPRDFVCERWYEKYGCNSRPQNVFKELQQLRERFHLPPDSRKVFCRIAYEFSDIFAVSPEAMQIRLSEMGLIQLEEDNQGYLL